MHEPEKLEALIRAWQKARQVPGSLSVMHDPTSCPRVVQESFRWGEAHLDWQDADYLCLGVALSHNQCLVGGVVLSDIPMDEPEWEESLFRLNGIGEELLHLLIDQNLINAALMTERRNRQRSERARAEGIHEWKSVETGKLREGFALLEPELVLAIRRGDSPEARRLLNALLLHLYNTGGNRLDRIKDLMAELIYLMRLTARDCGVDESANPILREPVAEILARVEDEEELSPWVHRQLEGILDAIAHSSQHPSQLRARKVVAYIRDNCNRPLGRAEVAQKAGLSESEFSRMLKRETGISFTEHLIRQRVDLAMTLLRKSEFSVQEIGYQCGFENPPHFSRTFKKITGQSPNTFRVHTSNPVKNASFRIKAQEKVTSGHSVSPTGVI
jgi:AraC-like DNA-binding protein